MSKKVTIKENYIKEADASEDINGSAVEITGQSIISVQFIWTSGVKGEIDFELSNDGKTFTSVIMEAQGANGLLGSEILELKTGSRYVRAVFKSAVDSTGTITAHLVSKREG